MLAVPIHHSVPWFLAGFYTQIKIDCCFISEIPMAAALHLPTGKINHSLTLPTHTQMLHTTGTKPGRSKLHLTISTCSHGALAPKSLGTLAANAQQPWWAADSSSADSRAVASKFKLEQQLP